MNSSVKVQYEELRRNGWEKYIARKEHDMDEVDKFIKTSKYESTERSEWH